MVSEKRDYQSYESKPLSLSCTFSNLSCLKIIWAVFYLYHGLPKPTWVKASEQLWKMLVIEAKRRPYWPSLQNTVGDYTQPEWLWSESCSNLGRGNTEAKASLFQIPVVTASEIQGKPYSGNAFHYHLKNLFVGFFKNTCFQNSVFIVALWFHFKVAVGILASHKWKHDYCRLHRNTFLGKM